MIENPLKGRRVLVVEDDYFLADELQLILEDEGVEVLGPVPTVTDGLRILSAGPVPDAASLDVNLRGETVFPLADALVARAVPFVFTIGYGRTTVPDAYARVPRLDKPVDARTMLTELARLLRDPGDPRPVMPSDR